jgi:Icc-related predicted phosphoesterase
MGFEPRATSKPPRRIVRLAAAGDVHSSEARRDDIERSFEALSGERIDLVLLAGDLTTWGKPEEAAILAAASRLVSAPVVAVLGNHDWHHGRLGEVINALKEGGIEVLDRSWTIHRVNGLEVGITGVKGFVGGFGTGQLPDFGEPLLREVYSETSRDVEALDAGLRAVANCSLRIVLLHYSPIEATLEGEQREIWPFLGAERLAAPILEHRPDLVLHGHAHAGHPEGRIGEIPVHNVSASVIGRDFWIVEMSVDARSVAPIR